MRLKTSVREREREREGGRERGRGRGGERGGGGGGMRRKKRGKWEGVFFQGGGSVPRKGREKGKQTLRDPLKGRVQFRGKGGRRGNKRFTQEFFYVVRICVAQDKRFVRR